MLARYEQTVDAPIHQYHTTTPQGLRYPLGNAALVGLTGRLSRFRPETETAALQAVPDSRARTDSRCHGCKRRRGGLVGYGPTIVDLILRSLERENLPPSGFLPPRRGAWRSGPTFSPPPHAIHAQSNSAPCSWDRAKRRAGGPLFISLVSDGAIVTRKRAPPSRPAAQRLQGLGNGQPASQRQLASQSCTGKSCSALGRVFGHISSSAHCVMIPPPGNRPGQPVN